MADFRLIGGSTDEETIAEGSGIRDNGGCPASLETRKVYAQVFDAQAEQDGMLRVVDESGEDYLYPARLFVPIAAPPRRPKGRSAVSHSRVLQQRSASPARCSDRWLWKSGGVDSGRAPLTTALLPSSP